MLKRLLIIQWFSRNLSRIWGLKILSHPPYSLDLTPCNFVLLPEVKNGRGHFQSYTELNNAVMDVLTSEGTSERCFISEPIRWNRCIEVEGDYVQGLIMRRFWYRYYFRYSEVSSASFRTTLVLEGRSVDLITTVRIRRKGVIKESSGSQRHKVIVTRPRGFQENWLQSYEQT